ncbi:MAG: DUF951 domain-containing protein [bacterium]|jgi:hypothetical protein|nr:DUF951 domain-containing protein [bacterium]MDD4152544.1 DUF951 domain-containing protein [bacterium]MDD4557717.1 DUF951 domain-containing protein [bacterium]
MVIHPGDLLELKKPHPCGSKTWEVTRTGADIGMVCQGCGHYVLIARRKLEPRIKSIRSSPFTDDQREQNR